MDYERARKYFGDIIPEDRLLKTKAELEVEKQVNVEHDDFINEILWDAFNGRAKHSTSVIDVESNENDYYEEVENSYVELDEELKIFMDDINEICSDDGFAMTDEEIAEVMEYIMEGR